MVPMVSCRRQRTIVCVRARSFACRRTVPKGRAHNAADKLSSNTVKDPLNYDQ